MGYEIPQQLEYKEKIMFGLTFKQLGYGGLFGSIALLLFFRLPFGLYVRGMISSVFTFFGVLFMFFNFDSFLVAFVNWFKNRKVDGEKFKQFKNVKEIKDNLIVTNKSLSVLKVEPINFKIKPEKEQQAITITFQKFLNSLEFPVQILVNTTAISLDEYLNNLKINKDYEVLFNSYKNHLKNTISDNAVMNRNFYIVIPDSDEIKIRIIQDKLNNLNLKYKRLKDKELEELVDKFFNNDLTNERDYIQDKKYNRVISAYGYPRNVESGFLDKIISSPGDFDISLFIEPYPIETMMVNLNKELQKQRSDLYSAEQKGIINPSLEIKYRDTRNILEQLQKGQDKLFNISLYVKCKADSIEELNLLTKKVESELNSIMIIPKVPYFRMLQGYKSTSPLAENKLNINRNVTTKGLSAFFPFTSPFLQIDNSGIWMGLNKNKIPVIRDIFKLTNPNGCVLATSGSGKSYFTKLLITRYLLNNVKVMVVDPQGEYKNLVKTFNGQRVDLSRDSDTMINPLDLMGHDYSEKRLALMDLMPIMLGELTEPQKAFLDKAITSAYNKKGINEDPKTWNNKAPILSDIKEYLESVEKRAITLEKTTIRSLINRLNLYTEGVFSFMNKQTNINFDNNFVCFDIGSMPKQVKPVVMFLVLDYVYMKMKDDLSRKLLIIDEAWSLLGRAEEASYIFEIVKTCRKFNMGLLLINQEVGGLLNSEAGKSVLANSAYTFLMKQKPAVIDNVCNTFHLSNHERTSLLTAGVGEGILIIDDDHSELKVIASDEEHKLITTNADEILKNKCKEDKMEETKILKIKPIEKMPIIEIPEKDNLDVGEVLFPNKESKEDIEKQLKQIKPEKKEVTINVYDDKGCYKKEDLSKEEIEYRLKNGYHESQQWDFETRKSETFLLKPRFNESDSHMFLIYRIAEYLKKFTSKIWLFETEKPDIIFLYNGKKYAIEVETGMMYEKAPQKLKKKVETLYRDFGDNWFFVVTRQKKYWKYSKLGQTCVRKDVIEMLNKFLEVKNGNQSGKTE